MKSAVTINEAEGAIWSEALLIDAYPKLREAVRLRHYLPIERLAFPVNASLALRRAGILTLLQLMRSKVCTIKRVPGLGEASFNGLLDIVASVSESGFGGDNAPVEHRNEIASQGRGAVFVPVSGQIPCCLTLLDDWVNFAGAVPLPNFDLQGLRISEEGFTRLDIVGITRLGAILSHTSSSLGELLGLDTADEVVAAITEAANEIRLTTVQTGQSNVADRGGAVIVRMADRPGWRFGNDSSFVSNTLFQRWSTCDCATLPIEKKLLMLCKQLRLRRLRDLVQSLQSDHPYFFFDRDARLKLTEALDSAGIRVSSVAKPDNWASASPNGYFESVYLELRQLVRGPAWRVFCLQAGLHPEDPRLSSGKSRSQQQSADAFGISRARAHQIADTAHKVWIPSWLSSQHGNILRTAINYLCSESGGVIDCDTFAGALCALEDAGNGLLVAISRLVLEADCRYSRIPRTDVFLCKPFTPHDFDHTVKAAEQVHRHSGGSMPFEDTVQALMSLRSADLPRNFVEAVLRLDARFTNNNSESETAVRRSLNSLIVAALKEIGQPAHYSAITSSVNSSAYAVTARTEKNILNRLNIGNALFVYQGRGVYGLAEWGLARPKPIVDLIEDFLTTRGWPASLEEIKDAVLGQRLATAASVSMSLSFPQNHQGRFVRIGNGWGLSSWAEPRINAVDTEHMDLVDLLFSEFGLNNKESY